MLSSIVEGRGIESNTYKLGVISFSTKTHHQIQTDDGLVGIRLVGLVSGLFTCGDLLLWTSKLKRVYNVSDLYKAESNR